MAVTKRRGRKKTRAAAAKGYVPARQADADFFTALDEKAAWAAQSAKAEDAVKFWNGFMNLQEGDNNDKPLSQRSRQRILTLIRAISWVESRHGTGTGSTAAIDPMQSGNPGDFWKEFADCSIKQDHFVLGPTKPNFDACELPDAAAADSGFSAQAKFSQLSDPTDGHNDAKFNAVMSYNWGVPIFIHKMNTGAGDKTYQCGDLSDDRLVDGAVFYNGGGVKDYRQRILDALTLIGGLPFAPTEPREVSDLSGETSDVLTAIVNTLQGADSGSGKPRLFFPNGIDLIDLQMDIKGGKVGIKIAGPTSTSGAALQEMVLGRIVAKRLVGTVTDGIDVSKYQGDVDWAKVASAGKVYSYMKATEGETLEDEKFVQNWSEAKEAGVMRGAYHFFIPTVSVKDQVDNFVGTVGSLEDTDMPPMLDLEKRTGWDGIPVSKRAGVVNSWLQAVQKALKCRPIVYTSKSFMDQIMGGSTLLGDYPLFVVDYNNAVPDLPDGWDDWTFWQFSESGSCNGIKGKVDLDHFSGDLLALQNFVIHQHGSFE